jgi:hypothetical protein
MRKIILLSAIFLTACQIAPKEEEVVAPKVMGDTHWTLEFTLLKNNKPTEVKTYQFETRMECFNTMYKMQEAAKKVRNQTGGGLCYKLFADGQERTSKDLLTKQ